MSATTVADTLTTERLRLRRFGREDEGFVLALHQNPDLARFIPSAALTDLAGARGMLARFQAPQERGFGWWCITLADETPVGAILLKNIPASAGRAVHDVEIGWRQHADHTGSGYVTEAARAVLDQALHLDVERIVAVVDPGNLASQRVCTRLGMSHLGRTTDYYDHDLELFAVSKPR